MKKFIPYVITCILIIAILILSNPFNNMKAFSNKDSVYYQKYANMDEAEVYEELMTHDIDYILHETEMLENDIGTIDLDIYIPFAQALLDKEPEIDARELLDLLESEQTKEALETILIQMYIDKNGDSSQLKQLLNSDISDRAKYDIVSKADFTEKELLTLFEFREDSFIYALMIRMHSKLPEDQFYEKGMHLLMHPRNDEEKYAVLWHTPALYVYAKKQGDFESCHEIVNQMYIFYENEADEIRKKNIIKNLGMMEDMDIIRDIIHNDSLKDSQYGAVLYAVPYFLMVLDKPVEPDDLQVILESMMICPAKEVAEAIINNESVEMTDEVQQVLLFIEENGAYACKHSSE